MWIGQPLCLWHTVSHLWMSTWLSNLVLEPDPLEMGVGNLLQEDWFLRYGKTGITSLGQQIIDITSEFNQAVQMSISCGEKNHPFSDAALRNIRQCLGATPEDGVAEGQPFFLTLISRLAKASGDPDWKYEGKSR